MTDIRISEKWAYLVKQYEFLGGIAKNIMQKDGDNGRGIYQIDKDKFSEIFIPSHLMINVNDVYLFENNIRIKKHTKYSFEISEFFHYYQDNFSWGEGGALSTESFEKGLKQFPVKLKELLKSYCKIDLFKRHEGLWSDIIMKQFLNARIFKFKNHEVICPILELVNHDVNAVEFQKTIKGIRTVKHNKDKLEFTHCYNYSSSLMRAVQYGFFCEESIVFSLPFRIKLKDQNIEIFCKGNVLRDDSLKSKKTNYSIIIDGIPIGSQYKKLFILEYYKHLIEKLNINDKKYTLLREIININIYRREGILKQLDIDNYASSILRKAISHELNLLSKI